MMGYQKGKSLLMILTSLQTWKYGNRQLWCRGYDADIVGRNKKAIEAYIHHQRAEDKQYEPITMKELIDPFTGEPVEKGK